MNETIEQIRRGLEAKIKAMEKAAYGDIGKENAREAAAALNNAETWYFLAAKQKRRTPLCSCRGQFEIAEKNFWKIIRGGEG